MELDHYDHPRVGIRKIVGLECSRKIKKQILKFNWGWCTGMTQRDGTGREVGGAQDGEHM